MNNNDREKNPAEIFKLFDKWAELLPKEGQELHSGASFSRIGNEIKQHCSSMENRGIYDNNTTSDPITDDQQTAVVKQEVVKNTEKEDLKPNFLFELKHDNNNGNTSQFECVYDFCLALEKFCKSKSTAENRLDIDEDWKKLLFTCSSHNPERIMWIHLTFQTSNRLKLTWKQVVRRLMANFDDPKRLLSLEATLSKFKFLPEFESIYAANSEFARYADELGDDTKRIVELYVNGMPSTMKEVLISTIAYDESTHFRYSLLDVQQRAAVFLTANENDLIFYSKSAHLAIALEYEKVDTKNCEFHLLADHSTIGCPDYTVLRFPYMHFTPLKSNPTFTTTTTPTEGITSEAGTQLTQLKPKITRVKDIQQPIYDTAVPKSKLLSTLVDTGQTKNSMTAQKPSVPAASPIITEQVRNPVVQQSPSVLASAAVGHNKDQVIQQEHPTPGNPTTTSKPQTSNVVLINNPAEKERDSQAKATQQAKFDSTFKLKKTNQENANTSTNTLNPNSVARNLTTRAPAFQTEMTKSLTSPQKPVDNTAKTSTTTLKGAPSQRSTEAGFTWKILGGRLQLVPTVEQQGISQAQIIDNSLPAKEKLTSEIPTGPAADRGKAAIVYHNFPSTQHLHVQRKNAAPVQMKPKAQGVKINVPSNTSQAAAQQAYQPPAAAFYTSGSPAIKESKRDLSSSSQISTPRLHSPNRSSRKNISRSPDQHYRRSQSPPRRRRRLTSPSSSRGSESPERGCYIHGKAASHSTKDCRQAQLVIQPRKLNLEPQNLPPPAPGRTNQRGVKPNNICIFCGLVFKPGHLGYCEKILARQRPKRR